MNDFTIPVSVCEVDESISAWPFRKPEAVIAGAIESGRVTYLADPVAGLRRYEKSLREFTGQVDDELDRLRKNGL